MMEKYLVTPLPKANIKKKPKRRATGRQLAVIAWYLNLVIKSDIPIAYP
jgi:hypothetical protein